MNTGEEPFVIDSSMKINHVHLNVTNLSESLDFYKSILGFRILKENVNNNTVLLSADPFSYVNKNEKSLLQLPLIMLSQMKENIQEPKHLGTMKRKAGLYHFAILLPEREYLAAFLSHIKENLNPQYYEGMADHAVSESIYIHDPDHIGIEIYRDRSPSEWDWKDNKVHMVTEPLDVTDLLTRHKTKTWKGMPPGTIIGHIHLHIANLNRAQNFYSDVLGLNRTATYPGAYFFAADRYHHHIATNTWLGSNILSANNSEHYGPGLDHYAIALPNNIEDIKKLRNRFTNLGIIIDDNISDIDRENYDNSFYIYDLDGIKIQFLFC